MFFKTWLNLFTMTITYIFFTSGMIIFYKLFSDVSNLNPKITLFISICCRNINVGTTNFLFFHIYMHIKEISAHKFMCDTMLTDMLDERNGLDIQYLYLSNVFDTTALLSDNNRVPTMSG